MKTIKLNIFSSPEDFNDFENEIVELLTENNSNYSVLLMRDEDPTPENTIIEIDCEFPLIGKLLDNIIKENDNINYENFDYENSHIMNKIIVIESL